MQTLPSREQGEHKVTDCLLEAGKHGSRNWIEEQGACSPRWRDEGRGESACMAPQGITGRQPASQPLVVVELDMTVDPRWLCGAESCFCEGLESGWISIWMGLPHMAQILRRTNLGSKILKW
jgi:hypothetical protein